MSLTATLAGCIGGLANPPPDSGSTSSIPSNADTLETTSSIGTSSFDNDGTTGTTGTGDTPLDSGFIDNPDGGGAGFECDIFAQDCPVGEKCMPWANDGSGAWNATRCSPIADDPGEPGQPCTVEGSPVSGVDDCDLGSMCWGVDPGGTTGTCVAMCLGSPDAPQCEDPDDHCTVANDGLLAICQPLCDPLEPMCADDEGCYPVDDAFICSPDGSGRGGAYGEPCEFINGCDPGLLCADSESVADCAGSPSCCTELCRLGDPQGDEQCTDAPAGMRCEPWFDKGRAPPGQQDTGVCQLPG